jgi:hypothetical protein
MDEGGRSGLRDEEGGFDWAAGDDADVVFLDGDEAYDAYEFPGGEGGPRTDPDPDSDPDSDPDAVWSGEERIHGGRDPRLLPPNPPRSRILASILVLAVFLGCTGAAFDTAYHRHATDRRIANELDLEAGANPPTIPDLGTLGVQHVWHADLEEQVVVPVLNQSPEPVRLLGAVLQEPGMRAAAALEPVGAARLAPGQTGKVTGRVTVDCTQYPDSVFPFFAGGGGGGPNGPGPGGGVIPAPSTAALLVRAQTAGGRVAQAALDPDADGPDLQQRICQQEGYAITGASSITAVADARTHSLRIDLTLSSTADIAMTYHAQADFTRRYQISGSALADLAAPEPTLPDSGTVQPGQSLHVAFDIQVLSCPVQALSTDQAYVQILLLARGNPVDTIVDAVHLATPLAAACGRG